MADLPASIVDRETVAALSRRYSGSLHRYLARRGLRSEDIEDASQDVFEKLAGRADVSEIARIEGYLFQTASNVVIDYYRRGSARRVANHIEYEDDLHAPEALSPERSLLARQELARLEQALRELPERSRNILMLSRFEGFSHGEIARYLNVSTSTVEKHLAKALMFLTRRLGRPDR